MDYMGIALRVVMLAVVSYGVVGQILKPGLRLLVRWRRRRGGPLSTRTEEALRWFARVATALLGSLLGLLPAVWPSEVPGVWGVLLGAAAGFLAVPIHHGLEAALPAGFMRLLGGPSIRDVAEEPEGEVRDP